MNRNNQEILSRSITVLRFPLAVMIVAIHTNFNESLNLKGIEIPFTGEWAHELIKIISVIISDCVVPIFFIISGYLYFFTHPQLTWKSFFQKSKKKCLTLLVPYISWNILAIIVNPEYFLKSTTIDKILGFWSLNLQWGAWDGPWNGPLWFVRDLFIVMLFSMFIKYLINKLGGISILFFAIPYFFQYTAIFPGLSFISFTFFTLGAWLAIKHPNFIQLFLRNKLLLLPIWTLFFTLRYFTLYNPIMKWPINIAWIIVSIIVYFALAVYIAQSPPKRDLWEKLAAASFTIFSMHRIINAKITALGLTIINKPIINGYEAIILYILTIILTTTICYITYHLISQFKILSTLLLGGRK